MNNQIISDLHGECLGSPKELWNFIIPSASIVIVAGDIHSYRLEETLNELSTKFEKVIAILGNHDYYMNNILSVIDYKPDKSLLNENVVILNRDCYELVDVVFIGCTLWSDFKNNDFSVNQNAKLNINDFYRIKKQDFSRFTPDDAIEIFNLDKQFIIDSIEQYKNLGKKIVVITHFIPSYSLVLEKWKTYNNLLNYYFSGNCDSIIEKYNDDIDYFIFAHSHDATDKFLGNIRCICNPLGYPNENLIYETKVIKL